ncbi:MAG TPA: hypothetical protein VLY24_17770 [Bryobacteraceae bacterium]|nr:hypothetical protein [Bryobacteraceae bacterium]
MARQSLLHTAWGKTAIAPRDLSRIAERLLLQLPIFLAVALGLIFIVGRFVAVLKENLKEPPDSLSGVLLLMVMIGGVAAMSILACTAVGMVIGWALTACFGKRLHRALSRHSNAAAG